MSRKCTGRGNPSHEIETVATEKNITEKEEMHTMANCAEMKEGDLFKCEICALELQVVRPCSCTAGEEISCTVPLQCCGQDMVKK